MGSPSQTAIGTTLCPAVTNTQTFPPTSTLSILPPPNTIPSSPSTAFWLLPQVQPSTEPTEPRTEPTKPRALKGRDRSEPGWEVLTNVRCRECNRSPGLQLADVTPGLINSVWLINLSHPGWDIPKLPAEATELSVEPSGLAGITRGTQHPGSFGFKGKRGDLWKEFSLVGVVRPWNR